MDIGFIGLGKMGLNMATRLQHAGQEVDEGRLARAVLAEERVDAPRPERDAHPLEDRVAGKTLLNPVGRHDGRRFRHLRQ